VTSPQEQHDLDEYEAWARARLEPVLGPLRVTDRRGGPEGLHDFAADLADGTVAAIEVTSEVDGRRLSLASQVERRGLVSFRVQGLNALWLVGLTAGAQVSSLSSKEKLSSLLADLEAEGRTNALDIGDYRDPFVMRLGALGIESASAVTPKAGREGTVMVRPGVYGGFGWSGSAIDTWLDELLASDRGVNKVRKLGRADASERHLAIVLDPFSPPGMGIPLALTARHERGAADYGMPSLAPPEPLTHAWLMPMLGTSDALHWRRGTGWTIIEVQRPG
jgi:hypothetical protein